MDQTTAKLQAFGTQTEVSTLDQLPPEIICMILEQTDCISDLASATHSSPVFFRPYQPVQEQMTSTVLCNRFEVTEFIALHHVCSLPDATVLSRGDFEAMLALVKSSRPQAIPTGWSPIKLPTSLRLGYKIERFGKTLFQICGKYFNEGSTTPAIPCEDSPSTDSGVTFSQFMKDIESMNGIDVWSFPPAVKSPTRCQKLQFFHALCNLEVVRKLVGGPRPSHTARTRLSGRAKKLRELFSLYEWLQMHSIIMFLDGSAEPCFNSMWTRVKKQEAERGLKGNTRMHLILRDIVHTYQCAGGLRPEFFYVLSLGLETCLDMMNIPDSPKHLALLKANRGGFIQCHNLFAGLVGNVMSCYHTRPKFSSVGYLQNLSNSSERWSLHADRIHNKWETLKDSSRREMRGFIHLMLDISEATDVVFGSDADSLARSRSPRRAGW